MLLIILGVALFFNFTVIYYKLGEKMYFSAILDALFLYVTMVVFSGSFNSLAVGTIGSALFSVYLIYNPPKFSIGFKNPFSGLFRREHKRYNDIIFED